MSGNELGAAAHLHITALLAYPNLSARIAPRHRVTAAVPGDICIPRYLALLVIGIRIGKVTLNRRQVELVFIPAD